MKTYQVNDEGFYGNFGGAYIPEILYQCVEQLKDNYRKVLDSDDFRQEFHSLLRDYVGRPSPLYLAKRLSERYGCRIYLKRASLISFCLFRQSGIYTRLGSSYDLRGCKWRHQKNVFTIVVFIKECFVCFLPQM